jgi:acetoin utilization deacetylase AcuC-like enzyme
MPIPVVFSERHRLHVPDGEIWMGIRIAGTELPVRCEVIAARLREDGHLFSPPEEISTKDLTAVHTPELVAFLTTAWERWQGSPYPTEPGQDRVVPYAFPLSDVTLGRAPRRPASVGALTGMFAMDTMTLIGPGTWEAVKDAAAAALTAASMVSSGSEAVYAAVRPPGHHAGTSFYGGSCYLNNAALAARRLVDRGLGPVVVIDLDAHHGNGTQQIFYRTDTVRYGSLHIDPGAGYFPHWLGFADEKGEEEGIGANLNLPLDPGSGDRTWLAGVGQLASFGEGAHSMVVSLGVDAWKGDPESPLEVSVAGYKRAGSLLGQMDLPTVIVQEGGYDLDSLADLVAGFLDGFERGR